MRVICAAEPWGYGPASKLRVVAVRLASELRRSGGEVELVFAGAGTGLDFARLNRDCFDDVVELGKAQEILDATGTCDAVLSVMDPWAALLGARAGVPTFYVDSLFWFWQWERLDLGRAPEEAERWRTASTAELQARVASTTDYHWISALAYHWATRAFVQRSPTGAARISAMPRADIQQVGCVIDDVPRDVARGSGPPLISLSGGLSHVGTLEVGEKYCDAVMTILAAGLDLLDGSVVAAHPCLVPRLRAGGWDARALSAQAMGRALAAAPFALVPAGLTTAFEAASAGVPLVFLPEQHGGHQPNRAMLAQPDAGAYDDLFLSDHYPLKATDPVLAIQELVEAYERLSTPRGARVRAALQAEANESIGWLMVSDAERSARAARQRGNVERLVGSLEGAAEIVAAITHDVRHG